MVAGSNKTTLSAVVKRFPGSRYVDRRVKPQFGYRAVHVIVSTENGLVEVQIRTRQQDQWAQAFERLGDLWGRGIRYGETPVEPVIPGVTPRFTRADIVAVMMDLSEMVARSELSGSEEMKAKVDEQFSRLSQALEHEEEIVRLLAERDRLQGLE